ncbi:Deleted in autism protein 1 [Chionoecetes opilio]|uniref:Deleted in autism protein 1 n=1 Tax=Chionoecetes opilio TaxID=41210 RepID=A0A8J4XV25_CHIOP|nr:Deleted in autism protein 1 [Chionoecetes opilio]
MGNRRKIMYGGGALLLLTVYYICGRNQPLDEKFMELSSCPACYGQNLCPRMLHHQDSAVARIELTGVFSLKVMKFLNYKNVYFGCSEKDTVVLKKLAHDSELLEFDKKICGIHRMNYCNVSEAIDYMVKKNDHDVARIIEQHPALFTSDGIMCNHSRILQYLYQKYAKVDTGAYQLHHFLTLLAINFEPLLINAFQHTNWFPALRGMCGRVIVEDYVGPTLSQLSHVSWLQRADYARQLLEMAQEFSSSEFRLYLTDVSLDNFAVDSEGRVKVIDAENIVLLDPSVRGLETTEHVNKGIGCRDCLSFSSEDLCGHTSADHNFFAICKGMLSSTAFSRDLPMGLLYAPPPWVIDVYPSLQTDVEDCAGHLNLYHLPRRRKAALHLHSQLKNVIWKSLKYS